VLHRKARGTRWRKDVRRPCSLIASQCFLAEGGALTGAVTISYPLGENGFFTVQTTPGIADLDPDVVVATGLGVMLPYSIKDTMACSTEPLVSSLRPKRSEAKPTSSRARTGCRRSFIEHRIRYLVRAIWRRLSSVPRHLWCNYWNDHDKIVVCACRSGQDGQWMLLALRANEIANPAEPAFAKVTL